MTLPSLRLFDLTGKTALVTGASYGLGVTFAEALAGAGASVILTARSAEKLEEAAKKIRESGGDATVAACDVTDPEQVEALVAAQWERAGRIDILVNNAGVAEMGVPERVPNDAFAKTIQVNLLGVWYLSRAVGSRMLADGRGGSIINISSICGLTGMPNHGPAYQASKFAVVGLTQNLAVSWGDRGVRVNAIAPGYFPSEMTNALLRAPSFEQWVSGNAALGRPGRPEELAGALIYLASDASSFVTGQVLAVDGGWTAAGGANNLPDELLEKWDRRMPGDLGKRIGVVRS